jgi:anti-sigma B factor antagonist
MAITAKMARRVGFGVLGVLGLLGLWLAWAFVPGSPVVREPQAEVEPEDDEPPAEPEPRAPVKARAVEPRRRLRLESINGVTVVHFVDPSIITEEDSQELGDQLDSLVENEGQKQLLLDLGNVGYLSSPALTKLVYLKKKVAAAKGKIKLCCLQPDLREVFRLTRVDTLFEIYSDQQAALDTFQIRPGPQDSRPETPDDE